MSYTANTTDIDQIIQEDSFVQYTPGEAVKGTVIWLSNKHIVVDLDGKTTGVILGKEMNDILGTVKNLELWQEVMAIVLDDESEDGSLLLSFRKAGQMRAWEKYQAAYETKEIVEVSPTGANKGWLLVEIAGIKAFVPVSQLSPENYPRVDNANASRILEKLETLIGKKLRVRIIGIDKEEGRLIFSEREVASQARVEAVKSLKVGTIVNWRVAGVVKFGIFVTFDGLEGLVHISEIAWGHVKDPKQYAKIGDEIKIKVIGIEGEKISLSIKQLQEDPWLKIAEEFKKGTIVKGKINKVSEFGAFVTLGDEVNGLIHLSEIDHWAVESPSKYFKEGEEIEAKVIDVDLKEHRIALSTKAMKEAPKKEEKKVKVKEEIKEK